MRRGKAFCFLILWGIIATISWAQESGLKLVSMQVNSTEDEDEPHFSPSQNSILPPRLYFSRSKGKENPVLMVSKWDKKSAQWATPFTIGAYIESKAGDASCYLTEEGKFPQVIIYATRKDEKNSNYDLFRSFRDAPGKDREDRAFNPGRPLVSLDTEMDEMHPWLTKDQMQIFFSRKENEGWQVWTARRVAGSGVEGNFDEPKRVEEIPTDFFHATINPLGTMMFLEGPMEKGRRGIFYSKKITGKWGAIKPVEKLNHADGKIGAKSPNLTRDGVRLYFASDRPGGKGGLDLYSVLVSELKLN